MRDDENESTMVIEQVLHRISSCAVQQCSMLKVIKAHILPMYLFIQIKDILKFCVKFSLLLLQLTCQ